MTGKELEVNNLFDDEMLEELKTLFQIKTLDNERRYWLIRAGKESCFFEEFYTRKFTGVNIPSSNDLTTLQTITKDELKSYFEQEYPDENSGHLIGKLYNFIHEIKIGDIIVMPSARREKIAFGIIEGNLYLDDSLILEESLNNSDDFGIPNKRRKVNWIKLVESTQLPSKLLLNLFSPHGLSAITDNETIELINTNIDDFFIKNSTAYMTFDIKTEENIALEDLTTYLNTTNEIINFTNSHFNSKDKVALKINLNSPGAINFFGPYELVLASGIILALIGCNFEINAFEKIKLKVKSPGILGYIKSFLEYHKEKNKQELEYKKVLINLKISEPEKMKELIKLLENEKNQKE